MRHTFGILWLISATVLRVSACSCAPPPPPCQAIGQSELVFLGTVTQLTLPERGFKTAKMLVDRAFKGKLNGTEELFDDGMCDGPRLEVGHQYLMYTTRFPGGGIPARGCTRSRAIEYADEDIAFLKQYSSTKVTTHVTGTVRFRPDPDLDDSGRTPLKGVRIRLTHNDDQFEATTDSLGKYSLSDLPAGDYNLDAELPGYRVNWSREKVSLQPSGCAVADVLMKVDRRIQGVISDARGAPVPGALVEMISTQPALEKWKQPILLSVSDDQGRYAIDGIPAGEYYLGTSIGSTPTKYHPYPRVYYPDVFDPKEAVKIAIVEGAATHDYDLRVPAKLALIEIQGRILRPDGKPPAADEHPQVRFKEPGLGGQIEQEIIEVDAEGRFRFELCEGIAYSAFAFAGPPRNSIYSAPLEFVATKENRHLEFILNKSSDEFSKFFRK